MFSSAVLPHAGRKRDREDVSQAVSQRQPQYGRSGLLARAADEERMAYIASRQEQSSRKPKGADSSVPAAELSKFIPGPFVATPMLLTGGIASTSKAALADSISALQAQLRILTADSSTPSCGFGGESPLEVARRTLVERFVVSVVGEDGIGKEEFDERSAADASEALRIFNASVSKEIERIRRRIGSLQQESKTERKEAVLLLPTSYLQGLLHHTHFLQQTAGLVAREGLSCAEEKSATLLRNSSILPLPLMAQRMMDGADKAALSAVSEPSRDEARTQSSERPIPLEEALQAFHHFLFKFVKVVDTEFTCVELPLSMTHSDLDAAESKRYPPAEDGISENRSPSFASSVTAKSHTKLTRSVHFVILRDGRPIEGQRPIPALHLVGEKYYEVAGDGRGAGRGAVDDPLSAFGFQNGAIRSSALRAKYRFHLLPFPGLSSVGRGTEASGGAASTVTVDTVAIFGRSLGHITVPAEHPSVSGQHMAAHWSLAFAKIPAEDDEAQKYRPSALPLTVGETHWFLELQASDLGASNGTAISTDGVNTSAVPKQPISLLEVPASSYQLPTASSPLTSPTQPAAAPVVDSDKNVVVMRSVCSFLREHTADSISKPLTGAERLPDTFSLPVDVGFGPLASASHTLKDGDCVVLGVSTRRYAVVYDENGVVS